jgi:hypothetical protein
VGIDAALVSGTIGGLTHDNSKSGAKFVSVKADKCRDREGLEQEELPSGCGGVSLIAFSTWRF